MYDSMYKMECIIVDHEKMIAHSAVTGVHTKDTTCFGRQRSMGIIWPMRASYLPLTITIH